MEWFVLEPKYLIVPVHQTLQYVLCMHCDMSTVCQEHDNLFLELRLLFSRIAIGQLCYMSSLTLPSNLVQNQNCNIE